MSVEAVLRASVPRVWLKPTVAPVLNVPPERVSDAALLRTFAAPSCRVPPLTAKLEVAESPPLTSNVPALTVVVPV